MHIGYDDVSFREFVYQRYRPMFFGSSEDIQDAEKELRKVRALKQSATTLSESDAVWYDEQIYQARETLMKWVYLRFPTLEAHYQQMQNELSIQGRWNGEKYIESGRSFEVAQEIISVLEQQYSERVLRSPEAVARAVARNTFQPFARGFQSVVVDDNPVNEWITAYLDEIHQRIRFVPQVAARVSKTI